MQTPETALLLPVLLLAPSLQHDLAREGQFAVTIAFWTGFEMTWKDVSLRSNDASVRGSWLGRLARAKSANHNPHQAGPRDAAH